VVWTHLLLIQSQRVEGLIQRLEAETVDQEQPSWRVYLIQIKHNKKIKVITKGAAITKQAFIRVLIKVLIKVLMIP
jgi:prolyl oligopeptidase PreP (S9A serine peptidase family)